MEVKEIVGVEMKIGECEHTEENKNVAGDGLTYAVCTRCNQHRRYRTGDSYSIVITKIGRIGKTIVMPLPGIPVDLIPEEHRLFLEALDQINQYKEEKEFQEKMGRVKKKRGIRPTVGDKRRKSYSEEEWPHDNKETVKDKDLIKEVAMSVEPTARGRELVESIEEQQPIDRSKPADWATMYPQHRGKWYDSKQDLIAQDIKQFGERAAQKLWGVSPSKWARLCNKLGITADRTSKAPEVKRIIPKKGIVAATAGTGSHESTPAPSIQYPNELPPLPAFSDTWTEATQLKWFDVYLALKQ